MTKKTKKSKCAGDCEGCPNKSDNGMPMECKQECPAEGTVEEEFDGDILDAMLEGVDAEDVLEVMLGENMGFLGHTASRALGNAAGEMIAAYPKTWLQAQAAQDVYGHVKSKRQAKKDAKSAEDKQKRKKFADDWKKKLGIVKPPKAELPPEYPLPKPNPGM